VYRQKWVWGEFPEGKVLYGQTRVKQVLEKGGVVAKRRLVFSNRALRKKGFMRRGRGFRENSFPEKI